MKALNLGDVVVLKSGGPPMTVSRVSAGSFGAIHPDYVECRWFDAGEFKTRQFLIASLKRIDDR